MLIHRAARALIGVMTSVFARVVLAADARVAMARPGSPRVVTDRGRDGRATAARAGA
jgi:hypothetical protein